MKSSVLLIVHEASRAGAPALALTFLRWLIQRGNVRPEVLILTDGLLRSEFEALTPIFVADVLTGRALMFGRSRTALQGRTRDYWIERGCRLLGKRSYDVI